MSVKAEETPPILSHKHYSAASAFKPENLLREARRQKSLPEAPVPEICILDPDGDMVRYLCNAGLAVRHPGWACYRTDLYVFREGGYEYGILGCIVGAAFAVLVVRVGLPVSCEHDVFRPNCPRATHRTSLSSSVRCAMREPATTTCRLPSTEKRPCI